MLYSVLCRQTVTLLSRCMFVYRHADPWWNDAKSLWSSNDKGPKSSDTKHLKEGSSINHWLFCRTRRADVFLFWLQDMVLLVISEGCVFEFFLQMQSSVAI